MNMVRIEVIGPGLVVNGPVAVIYKALTDAGYIVEMNSFAGQHQHVKLEDWPDAEIAACRERQQGMGIGLRVDPLPWGG